MVFCSEQSVVMYFFVSDSSTFPKTDNSRLFDRQNIIIFIIIAVCGNSSDNNFKQLIISMKCIVSIYSQGKHAKYYCIVNIDRINSDTRSKYGGVEVCLPVTQTLGIIVMTTCLFRSVN